jgi:hypothetical protein
VREISLQMAQELGLVPRVNQFDTKWTFGPLKRVVQCGDDEYRRRRAAIVAEFCFDKNLEICDYDRLTAAAPRIDGED